tara:strand:+ start:35181 stop:36473 length:1293 start_codon:yes stop_codon:yes gene_type:complete
MKNSLIIFKKKISIFLVLAVTILYGLSYIEVAEDHSLYGYLFDNYIHLNRRYVDVKKTKEVQLDEFQLLLDDSIITNIKNEYKYPNGKNSYQRSWEKFKAKLIFKNDTFETQIKGHGVTPVNHINLQGCFSIRVKLLNNKAIYGYNKFSFVVIERTLNRNMVLYTFSKTANLYHKPSFLVKLKLNNNSFFPYNLEPSNKVYCKNENIFYSKININKKGPIGFFKKEKTIFINKFNLPSTKTSSFTDVIILNSDQIKNISIHEEYYSKYLAVLFSLNFNGHGISNESNFMVHHDKYRWIPVIHRDNVPEKITNDTSQNITSHFKHQISKMTELYGDEFFITQLISKPEFKEKLRTEIRNIILQKEQIMSEIISQNRVYERLLSGGFLDVYFNWRDENKLPKAYKSTFLDVSLLENNFSFWEEKLDQNSFWK